MNKSEINQNILRAMHREPTQLSGPCYVCKGPLLRGSMLLEYQGAKRHICSACLSRNPIPAPAKPARGVLMTEQGQDSGQAPAGGLKPFHKFFHCLPPSVTAQQKGVTIKDGKPKFYTKSKLKQASKQLKSLFWPFAPEKPFTGPIRVKLIFRYPWRKTEKKSVMDKWTSYPIAERPDVENLCKLTLDVLTECKYWEDDSQISTLIASKYRGDQVGIELEIEAGTGSLRR